MALYYHLVRFLVPMYTLNMQWSSWEAGDGNKLVSNESKRVFPVIWNTTKWQIAILHISNLFFGLTPYFGKYSPISQFQGHWGQIYIFFRKVHSFSSSGIYGLLDDYVYQQINKHIIKYFFLYKQNRRSLGVNITFVPLAWTYGYFAIWRLWWELRMLAIL